MLQVLLWPLKTPVSGMFVATLGQPQQSISGPLGTGKQDILGAPIGIQCPGSVDMSTSSISW